MERLLQILPAAPRAWPVRYALTALIMLACCAVQYLIFRISGFTGFFIWLPGIFLSGLLFDRGSAFFATLIGCLFAVYILFPGFALPSNTVYVPLILFTKASVAKSAGVAILVAMATTVLEASMGSEEGRAAVADIPNFASGGATVVISEIG